MKTTKVSRPLTAERIETTPRELIIHLADRSLRFPWEECSARLASASEAERLRAELSPGGYGIHWPLIDEDLSVQGLVRDQAAQRET